MEILCVDCNGSGYSEGKLFCEECYGHGKMLPLLYAVKEIPAGRAFTKVLIQARDKDTIYRAVKKYERQYPPLGYATSLQHIHKITADVFEATLLRYPSCE